MIKPKIKDCFIYLKDFTNIDNFDFSIQGKILNVEFYIVDEVSKKGVEKYSFSICSQQYVVECILNGLVEPLNRKGFKILPNLTKNLILEYIATSINNSNTYTWDTLNKSLSEFFYTDYD